MARDLDRSALQIDELLRERQADAGAAHAFLDRGPRPFEPREQLRDVVGVDAGTGIAHRDVTRSGVSVDRQRIRPSRGVNFIAFEMKLPIDRVERGLVDVARAVRRDRRSTSSTPSRARVVLQLASNRCSDSAMSIELGRIRKLAFVARGELQQAVDEVQQSARSPR